MSRDLSEPLRDAIIGATDISSELAQWRGEPAVFTRRPIPGDATYPNCAISPDITQTDADALVSRRPIVVRDIVFYGKQPDHYRLIERLGYAAYELFHRNRFAIEPPAGYRVIQITAIGPVPAPTDDAKTVGRMVSLTIQLERNQS